MYKYAIIILQLKSNTCVPVGFSLGRRPLRALWHYASQACLILTHLHDVSGKNLSFVRAPKHTGNIASDGNASRCRPLHDVHEATQALLNRAVDVCATERFRRCRKNGHLVTARGSHPTFKRSNTKKRAFYESYTAAESVHST